MELQTLPKLAIGLDRSDHRQKSAPKHLNPKNLPVVALVLVHYET